MTIVIVEIVIRGSVVLFFFLIILFGLLLFKANQIKYRNSIERLKKIRLKMNELNEIGRELERSSISCGY